MSKARTAPTKPNTILEVSCELMFENKSENFSISVGEIFRVLADKFPAIEAPLIDNFEMAERMGTTGSNAKHVHKFKDNSGEKTIQISPNTFSFHIRGNLYKNRDEYFAEFLEYWNKCVGILKIDNIFRTSLRYVNFIPFSDDAPNLSDWLLADEYVPKSVINSKTTAGFRSQFTTDKNLNAIIALQKFKDKEKKQDYCFYDLDVMKIEPEISNKEILPYFIELSDLIRIIFEKSKTDKYRQYLEE